MRESENMRKRGGGGVISTNRGGKYPARTVSSSRTLLKILPAQGALGHGRSTTAPVAPVRATPAGLRHGPPTCAGAPPTPSCAPPSERAEWVGFEYYQSHTLNAKSQNVDQPVDDGIIAVDWTQPKGRYSSSKC